MVSVKTRTMETPEENFREVCKPSSPCRGFLSRAMEKGTAWGFSADSTPMCDKELHSVLKKKFNCTQVMQMKEVSACHEEHLKRQFRKLLFTSQDKGIEQSFFEMRKHEELFNASGYTKLGEYYVRYEYNNAEEAYNK